MPEELTKYIRLKQTREQQIQPKIIMKMVLIITKGLILGLPIPKIQLRAKPKISEQSSIPKPQK